jgi:RNA polymerase sigma-70 factor (ECF subfamily)
VKPVPEAEHEARRAPGPGPAGAARSAAWLERCYGEHAERVLAAAWRVTGSATDAEDVLQTVFLRLSRRPEGEPLGEAAAGYLHRCAVHAALDVVRSRQRAGWVPLEAAGELPRAGPEDDPERTSRNAELRRALRLALARLPPRAAEVFALRYFEGLGNLEIAQLLGVSQGVVAVLLHRTRARLRRELAVLMGDAP